jgi:hypothetical protein
LYDSRFTDTYFVWCGKVSGSVPVMELKAAAVTYERTNNIYFDGCDFESNRTTCVKTTGDPAGKLDFIWFTNTKFDNINLAGPTLSFYLTENIGFYNTFASIQRNIAVTELVKFDRCNQINGVLNLAIQPTGSAAITRVVTVATNGGEPCRMNLFLSGTNWDAITDTAAVNLDNATNAALMNIKTYGPSPGNAGYLCSTKALTNYPVQSEALYGSNLQVYAPTGTSGDWMAIFEHALAGGGSDRWIAKIEEYSGSTFLDFMHNSTVKMRLLGIDPGAGETAMMLLYYNNAGAVTLQKVTTGANDSGGTGYKLLRVPN